mmetsp:Transcript_10368/g.15958  ORF Transcript_10368/g.15958 Transcript_10368/m.15958 type:complete len:95 (+) Transcript_10368:1029-1313(+)
MIDGKTWWRIEGEVPQWLPRGDSKTMADGTFILPSDSDWRPDIPLMITHDWKEAEHHKVEMEELQRHDRRLREAAHKKRKEALAEEDYYDEELY